MSPIDFSHNLNITPCFISHIQDGNVSLLRCDFGKSLSEVRGAAV